MTRFTLSGEGERGRTAIGHLDAPVPTVRPAMLWRVSGAAAPLGQPMTDERLSAGATAEGLSDTAARGNRSVELVAPRWASVRAGVLTFRRCW